MFVWCISWNAGLLLQVFSALLYCPKTSSSWSRAAWLCTLLVFQNIEPCGPCFRALCQNDIMASHHPMWACHDPRTWGRRYGGLWQDWETYGHFLWRFQFTCSSIQVNNIFVCFTITPSKVSKISSGLSTQGPLAFGPVLTCYNEDIPTFFSNCLFQLWPGFHLYDISVLQGRSFDTE